MGVLLTDRKLSEGNRGGHITKTKGNVKVGNA